MERMTKKEFIETNRNLIYRYANKTVSGIVGNKKDREKANFTGVYVLIYNDEVYYIGSALVPGRTVGQRLKIHCYGDKSNSLIVERLVEEQNVSEEEAKQIIENSEFLAFRWESFEYLMIQNTPGLMNSAGYRKKD